MDEFELGLNAFQQKQYTQAARYLQEAIKKGIGHARAFVGLGKCYFFLGELDLSLQALSNGIAIFPDSAQLYYNRGVAYVAIRNMLEAALSDFTKAVEFDPNLTDAHYNIGQIYLRKNCPIEAIQSFTRALSDNVLKNSDAYGGIASALIDLEKYDEAIANATMAIQLKPNNHLAYMDRGMARSEIHSFTLAIHDFTAAIQYFPDSSDYYYNRGFCYEQQQQYEEAIVDYSQAIVLNPKHAQAYNNRGNCLCNIGKEDAAIDDFTRAIQLQNFLAIANRANVYYVRKQYNEAIADYTKAISHEPNNPKLFLSRSKAYEEAGYIMEAQQDREIADRLEIKGDHS